MPAAASAGSAEPASSDKAPPEISAMCKAVSPRGIDAGGMLAKTHSHWTRRWNGRSAPQYAPARVTKDAGKRSTRLYMSPDGGTGFTDSGKGNLSRRPPARRSSSTRTHEIVLQWLLPSVVLRGRRRRQTRARWNAGVDPLHCLRCLHPVIRHLEHHILVLLALCTGCPTQALCGKIAVFFG